MSLADLHKKQARKRAFNCFF